MTVRFYQFEKKPNSTAVPTGEYLERTIRLKDDTSIINPVIELNQFTGMQNYNYCYIPAFSRYYFVTDISFDNQQVTYTLNIDVLASYKWQIGTSRQYILRSSNTYDGAIIDTMYPAKQERTVSSVVSGTIWETDLSSNTARLCVGVLSSGGSGSVTSIKVGYVDVACTAESVLYPASNYITNITGLLTHPQSNARGVYLNGSPYTQVSLNIPGFGFIQIDGGTLINATALSLSVWTDVRTGSATAYLYAVYGSGNSKLITKLSGNIGVQIQLSQVIASGLGVSTFTNILGSIIGGGASGLASGNLATTVLGGVSGAVQACGDALRSLVPQVFSTGSTGGLDALQGSYTLEYTFFTVVDENNTEIGRPLMQTRQISTIPGYILCSSEAEIATAGTQAENESIRAYLRSGFYYE